MDTGLHAYGAAFVPAWDKMVGKRGISSMRVQVTMNVPEFQAKWRDSTLKESAFAKSHFLDLCRVLGMPSPAEAKSGSFYTFGKDKTLV